MSSNVRTIFKITGKILVAFALLVSLIFSWAMLGDSLHDIELPFSIPSLFVAIAAYALTFLLVVDSYERFGLSISEPIKKLIDKFCVIAPVVCHAVFVLLYVACFVSSVPSGDPLQIFNSVLLLILAVLYPIIAITALEKTQPFFVASSILAFGPCVAVAIEVDSQFLRVLFVTLMLLLFNYSSSKFDENHPISPVLVTFALVVILVSLATFLTPAFVGAAGSALSLIGIGEQVQLPSAFL